MDIPENIPVILFKKYHISGSVLFVNERIIKKNAFVSLKKEKV